jgi:hypothetical protein
MSESQAGNLYRTDMATGIQMDISPQPRRNDGGPVGVLKYRFHWNTPIVLSPHHPDTVYVGANVVFKSTDFGLTWTPISPDLTTNDKEKQKDAGGPVWIENTTAEYHCTIISLAESPAQAGVIWAGTDDGNLQVTWDGGRTWRNLTPNVPELPPNSPVSHVEPSRTNAQTAYVAFDRHMLDDYKPYLYKTTDGGRSWRKITNGLPDEAYIFVVREDLQNPNLLFCGTERGLFVSFDAGEQWQRVPGLPPVPVHDIQIHPTEHDLVVGTHGRSIWVLDDITPLREATAQVLEKPAHLFAPRTAWRYSTRFARYGRGDRPLLSPNPPYGALFTYYLKEKPARGEVSLQILDAQGKVLRELRRLPQEPGIHRVDWDLRMQIRSRESEGAPQPPAGGRGRGGLLMGPQVLPGTYRVKLIVGDFQMEQPLTVKVEPALEPYLTNMKAGFQFALETLEMIRQLERTMRMLASVEEQINNLRQTARQQNLRLSRELNDLLDRHIKQIDELQAKVENPQTGPAYSRGPRLRSHLNSVYGMMSSNTGPTLAQVEFFNEVKAEWEATLKAMRDYLLKETPKLNEQLRANQLPEILVNLAGLEADESD